MHVLSIDVGSYSIKYVSSFVDRRKVNHSDMSEIVLRDYLADHADMSEHEAQAAIIEEIFDSTVRPDTKVIFQVDNEMMTTRFLTLPVKSKKKAELMLPFQLEEDIPYALSEIHYSYRMEPAKTQQYALVGVIHQETFENYYNILKLKDVLPNILTTEASVIENYFNQNAIAGPFCVLDMGHKTTKAYFFYNSRLIVTHVSYMGGQHVNEMISETYKIDAEEAIFYKHQNAFLLNSNQYSEVEETQKEFAHAMDKIFAPLVTDFSRWKIGFKVNYGLTLGHVFICGGTSNIKNIANYLTEKWETKVALLESFDHIEGEKVDLSSKNKTKFALANMMSIGMKRKNRFLNLLSGKFAQAGGAEIPLHSFAFIGVRIAMATTVFMIALMAERLFIENDIKIVNSKLTTIMKNEELAINGRLRRSVIATPKPVFDDLVKKQRGVRQEISTLQSALDIQALSPLVNISQLAASTQATLVEFKSTENKEITSLFSAENAADLNNLKAALERSSFNEVNIEIKNDKLQLKMTAVSN